MRPYREQNQIPNFHQLDYANRRAAVESLRTTELYRLQRIKNNRLYWQTKKNYQQTAAYIHLTRTERATLVQELAALVSRWAFARLFAECIDKAHFAAQVKSKKVDEQAFEQIVSRFEQYLRNIRRPATEMHYGLLIHDNNPTVEHRHTDLMRRFHTSGTLWTGIQSIIETPLYVDSQLTSMVQIADLCAYSLRRYLESNETTLFDLVFQRADRVGTTAVGVRHFTRLTCTCKICSAHRRVSGGSTQTI